MNRCLASFVTVLIVLAVPGLTAEQMLFRDDFASARSREGWTLQPPMSGLGPIARNGAWAVERGALVATGAAAPWTVRTAGDPDWTDYQLAVKVTIRQPGPKADYPVFHGEFDRYLPREEFPPLCDHTGQYRFRYYAGEFDWGSEAAVLVRYRDRNDCYRVQLSTEYQEIILWHGVGGYLQVVPWKLEAGKAYDLRVKAQGARLQVLVDGKRAIDYWHEALPTLAGGIGLAAYNSTVAFSDVAVTPLPPAGPQPPHQARFALRPWRTLTWLFDGNEPITLLEKNRADLESYVKDSLFYFFVKLRPGYRPEYQCWIAALIGGQATQLQGEESDIKLTGVGTDRLTMQFDTAMPDGSLKVHHTDVVSYDRIRGTYRHDLQSDLAFVRDTTISILEFFDPLTYNNKEPGRGVKYTWLPAGHQWMVITGEDGTLYRMPISQAVSLVNSWYGTPDHSLWMFYPDRAVCPVFETSTPGEKTYYEVCHWGYDWHQRFMWNAEPRVFKAGDTFTVKYALAGYRPEEGEKLFLASKLHPKSDDPEAIKRNVFLTVPSAYAFPVCDPAGNDFKELETARKPYVGWQWTGDYEMDREVGHGDNYSLRLAGPASVTGMFYHHMLDSYEKRYLCSFWVKTQGVKGHVVAKLKYSFGPEPCDTLDLGLSGDNDWTQVAFVSTVPIATIKTYDSSDFILSLEGTGRVWLDDWSVRPLADDEQPRELRPTPTPTQPVLSPDYLLYLRADEGVGTSCFDSSGHGNNAKLHGVSWVQSGRRAVLRFEDEACAFIPNLSPELQIQKDGLYSGAGLSIDAWVRPAAGKGGGSIVGMLNSPWLYLSAAGDKFTLNFAVTVAGKGATLSAPATVPADQWTHVAATVGEDNVARLYVGGKQVAEQVLAGKIGYSAWYQAISLGTYGKIYGNYYTGDLAEVRWWTRAATAAEIAAAAATAP